jgi:hypothetical protein
VEIHGHSLNFQHHRLFPCQHFILWGIVVLLYRMTAPLKFTVAKVARYVLPFIKPLTLGVLDLKNGTTKELLDAGLDFFGEEKGEAIKDYLKTEPDAAAGLIDEHLIRHTGAVLGTLVKRYAKEEAVKEHRADLLKLAKVTPGAWADFLASDKLKMPALRKDALHRQLTVALDPHATASALDSAAFVEFFRWLAVRKKLLGPLKPGLTPSLTKWITRHLNTELLVELCRDTPKANAAFKESVVRFLAFVQTEAAEAHREAKGAHQISKLGLNETRKLGKKVDDAIRSTSAESRLAAYKRSLLSAFSSYQELALDNYAAAEQTCPDIWDIFVHPACSKEHLRPEDMDAAQMESPPRLPAADLLPLLAREDHRRTVLLADPGMGKSTLIQSLIAHLASGRPLAGAPALSCLVPVPLILRDLVPLLPQDQVEGWTWDSLITVLLEHYKREETAPPLCEVYKGHEAEFRQIIHHSDDIYFLIDGLDEIGDIVKRQKIVECIQDGIRFADIKTRWLITSRVIGYEYAEAHCAMGHHIEKSMVSIHDFLSEKNIKEAQQQVYPLLYGMWAGRAINSLPSPDDVQNLNELLYKLQIQMRPILESSAPDDLRKATLSFGIRIAQLLYLAPFDDSRQDAFTSKWFKKRHSLDYSRELMGEVRAHHHDGVRTISRVPNLLCMMNMLKRSGKPLPDGRAALYDEIVKAYLGGIDSAYKFKPILGNTCPFEPAERRHLLALLGAHMQQQRTSVAHATTDESQTTKNKQPRTGNDSILISVPELRTLLLPAIEAMQQAGKVKSDHSATDLLDELLRHIASRSGLLIPRSTDANGNTVYGFTHLSFLEFFAAEWLGKEFERLQKRLARRAEALADGINLTEIALDCEFPAPRSIEHQRSDFPLLAAAPAWHEPLIFLLESRKSDAPTLLRWLFPVLHTPAPVIGTASNEHETPLLPLESVNLAVKLAHDSELDISPTTRKSWWRILWTAYLSWPHVPWLGDHRSWPIAPLLLGDKFERTEAIQALVDVFPQPSPHDADTVFPPLLLFQCEQLTGSDLVPLISLAGLETLDLSGCTGLDNLPDLSSLRSLKKLDLSKCTSLRDAEALRGLEGLQALEVLNLSFCEELTSLPDFTHLRQLRQLDLCGCENLKCLGMLRSELPAKCAIIWPDGKLL